jgi:ADP-ribose pyrophosphatase
MKISRLEEVLAYKNPWISVFFDRVKCANPKITGFTRIVESGGRPGVAILPIRENAFGFIRIFRYPIGCEVLEIPRGFGECDDPRDDARRELVEETGLECQQLIDLGQVHPNSGLLATSVRLFAALGCQKSRLETDGEVSELIWVPRAELQEFSKTIEDCFSLAAILKATQRGL